MDRKNVSQAPIYVRQALDHAARLAGMGDFAGAVAALLPVIKANPEVSLLFDRFGEYGLKKAAKQGFGVKLWSFICGLGKMPAVAVIAQVDPVKAMAMCEESLAYYIGNSIMLSLMSSAADAADAPWASKMALMVYCKFNPNNAVKLKQLAMAMQDNGQAIDALKIHQKISQGKQVSSLAGRAELREAMALASIERSNFSGNKDKANTADAEDAIVQQLLEGTIHDADQANLLIERFTAELRQKDSVDMRRKLADAYMVAGKFEEARTEYQTVADKLGVMDPVLDKHIEAAYVAQMQQAIDTLKASPESYEQPEAQILELEQEIKSYRWRHTKRRAEQFPKDMQLQFDFGELLFEFEQYPEAKAVFTAVADFPQKHRYSMIYLGRCALLENNADRAIECLKDALSEMGRPDKYKRETLYYLGNAYELKGEKEDALKAYREIMSSMKNYRDINDRIAKLTGCAEETK